ncbi:MAG: hypothetical protein OXC07_04980 [Kistimonas sp.]|nr:hypothetical protein [Kistimonas sp.]
MKRLIGLRHPSLCLGVWLACVPWLWPCSLAAHEPQYASAPVVTVKIAQSGEIVDPGTGATQNAEQQEVAGVLMMSAADSAPGVLEDELPPPLIKLIGLLYGGAVLRDVKSSDWAAWRDSFVERWGRKPGQERWEMQEVVLPEKQMGEIRDCMDELSLIRAVTASQKEYDYAVILGAPGPIMLSRMDWLASQWKQGVHFRQLVVLTGQRPLTPDIDRVPELMNELQERGDGQNLAGWSSSSHQPLHETELARLLLAAYSYPDGMEQVPVTVVDTPRKWQDGNWFRCHTGDTLQTWLRSCESPRPGSVLMVSSQPAAQYQKSVALRELPPGFSLDTIAEAAPKNISLAELLDSVSTWLRASGSKPPGVVSHRERAVATL